MSEQKSLESLVEYLKTHTSPKITSYIAGFENLKQLEQIQLKVDKTVEMRIRHAYDAVRVISEAYDDKTAMSWLFGNNTKLKESPAYVLRHSENLKDIEDVVSIAREFSRS